MSIGSPAAPVDACDGDFGRLWSAILRDAAHQRAAREALAHAEIGLDEIDASTLGDLNG